MESHISPARSRMYVETEGMTLKTAAQICGCGWIGDPGAVITGVSTDSRDACPGMLFVAVKGERFDGHDFTAKAFEGGAAAAMVSRAPDPSDGGNYIVADDTVAAFGRLASAHKREISPLTIAVTGSVGKTTTREYISAVLSRKYRVAATTDNLNSEIGLPVVLLRLRPGDEALVAEMGMQGLGEISYLSRMAQPDVAVITNIGTSHIGLLGSRENIAKAKLEIRDGLKKGGRLILNGHEPLLSGIEGAVYVSDCPDDRDAGLRITGYRADGEGHGVFNLEAKDGTEYRDIVIPTLGIHTALDASYAFAAGLSCGMSADEIREGLLSFRPAAMRQHIFRLGGAVVIEDCYNASPESVAAALRVLETVADRDGLRRCAVLGDMLELGDRSEELHRLTGKRAGESGVKLLIAVGEYSKTLAEAALESGTEKAYTAENAEEAGMMMKKLIREGDAVLVKASRGIGLERAIAVFGDGER